MDNHLEFLKMEYESLRGEMEQLGKELRDTERYTILIVSAIWVWLATHPNNLPEESSFLFWWFPVVIVVLGFIRFLGVQQTLHKIAHYVANSIEQVFLGENAGWENHLKAADVRLKMRWWVSSYLLWAGLLATSVFVALSMR